jgi:hypothetical protein
MQCNCKKNFSSNGVVGLIMRVESEFVQFDFVFIVFPKCLSFNNYLVSGQPKLPGAYSSFLLKRSCHIVCLRLLLTFTACGCLA